MKTRLLLSGLVLLGLAMVGPRLGGAAVQSEPARIVVRAGQALAPVSPMLFGQNYGPWMNTTETFAGEYRDAGVTLLRFPAGNWGDENDLFPNNLDDLAMLAEALGAEVSVQARSWRRGTPEKAAELVRYSNVENDYGFRYWEVGNEPDLYQRRPSRSGDPEFSVDWYNAHFALQGTSWQGLIGDRVEVGMLEDPRPVYGVYRLYSHWGTTQVDAESSDGALLPAFASLREDGRLAILVVNKDPLQHREAVLEVEGFRPAGQAQVWVQDEGHLAAELSAIAVAETFPYTFPPYSVTLFVLEPVPWTVWLLWAGSGLILVVLAALVLRRRRKGMG